MELFRLAGWVVLAAFLGTSSFGIKALFCIFLAIVFFLVGGMIVILIEGEKKADQHLIHVKRSRLPLPDIGIPKIVQLVEAHRKSQPKDRVLTGSPIIDESLQDILNYIIRDYVKSWLCEITHDNTFPNELRFTLQKIIITFSKRCQEVDWVKFLTTTLVEHAASHIRLYRKTRVELKKGEESASIIEQFFKEEKEMEKLHCRQKVCTDRKSEKEYFSWVSEILLFQLLPKDDFCNKPFRFLAREVLVNSVFIPVVEMLSDSDYVNQTLIWLCKDIPPSSDAFLTTIKLTDSVDELQAISESVRLFLAYQRSKDTGGDDDTEIKKEIGSLLYVNKIIMSRMGRLNQGVDTDSTGLPSNIDWDRVQTPGYQLPQLPLDLILKNNVALSCFMDFMTSIGARDLLFLYLNAIGWRVSSEQQISMLQVQSKKLPTLRNAELEAIRGAARCIVEEFLCEKSLCRSVLDEQMIRRLKSRVEREPPNETWFDEITQTLYEKFQGDIYLATFKKSHWYIQLLAELDLLKECKDDEDSISLDEMCCENEIFQSLDMDKQDSDSSSQISDSGYSKPNSDSGYSKQNSDSGHSKQNSDLGGSRQNLDLGYQKQYSDSGYSKQYSDSGYSKQISAEGDCKDSQLLLTADIIQTTIKHEAGRPFVQYVIAVHSKEPGASEDPWHVFRRYSEFYDFHVSVVSKYEFLSGLNFPGKKTFHNLEKAFVEKRRQQLNAYLKTLLSPEVLREAPGLDEKISKFLEHGKYQADRSQLRKTADILRTFGHVVKVVPEGLMSTAEELVGEIQRKFITGDNPLTSSERVGSELNLENEENIPLRILLLLMDEVFDLKSRNQWLRRRITTVLRQIIKGMFGDIYNRRIVEYVQWAISPEQIRTYLNTFTNSLWPGGVLAAPRPTREPAVRLKTRVAAKTILLSSITDEVKHIIGNETSRKGILFIFEMFQEEALNRRLAIVLFEALLKELFQGRNFGEIFQKLHETRSIEESEMAS